MYEFKGNAAIECKSLEELRMVAARISKQGFSTSDGRPWDNLILRQYWDLYGKKGSVLIHVQKGIMTSGEKDMRKDVYVRALEDFEVRPEAMPKATRAPRQFGKFEQPACDPNSPLSGIMPPPHVILDVTREACRRGFLPGVAFMGIEGNGKDQPVTIGPDGLKANDIGLYYDGSYAAVFKTIETEVGPIKARAYGAAFGHLLYKEVTLTEMEDCDTGTVGVLIQSAGKTIKGSLELIGFHADRSEVWAIVLKGDTGVVTGGKPYSGDPVKIVKRLNKAIEQHEDGGVKLLSFKTQQDLTKWLAI